MSGAIPSPDPPAIDLIALLETAAQGVSVVNPDLTIAWVSKGFLELYGFPEHLAVPGTPVADFVRWRIERGERQLFDDPSANIDVLIRHRVQQFAVMGSGVDEEIRPDGRVIEIRRARQPSGQLLSTYTDVTERVRIVRALRDQDERVAAILDSVQDGVITFDDTGWLTTWNRAASSLFGYSPDYPPQGLAIDDLVADLPAGATIAERVSAAGERHLRRPDGSVRVVDWRTARISPRTGALWLATLHDMTDRKAAEERLGRVQRLEAIGTLTGGIAHDFNNLLTVIQGNLQWLQEKATDRPDLLVIAQSADRAVKRGADLTQRLLAVGGRQRLRPEPVRLHMLIDGLVELLSRSVDPSIAVCLDLCAVDPEVFVDARALDSALLNLCRNACDAMPDGGTLTLSTTDVGDGVEILVTDTGSGMTPEVLAKAFEPFFTTKGVGKGTGLGLSSVYGFVQQSGGSIGITSTPGHGTVVRLVLPAPVKLGAPAPVRVEVQPAAPAALPARRGAVLVVEPDAEVCAMALTHCADLGYTAFAAADGGTALGLIEGPTPLDVLFVTHSLAGAPSCPQLVQRALVRRPDLRVVVAVDIGLDPMGDEGRILTVEKPYSRDDLATAFAAPIEAG